MKKKSLNLKITRSSHLIVKVHHLPVSLLKRTREHYSLTYRANKSKFFIRLTGIPTYFVDKSILNDTEKEIWTNPPVVIKKNNDQTFDVTIVLPPSVLKGTNLAEGKLLISQKYREQLSCHLELNQSPERDSAEPLKKKKQRNKQAVKMSKKRKQRDKTRHAQELVRKLEKAKKASRASPEKKEQIYTSKEIYLAHPEAFKRCGNCANYVGSKCSAHGVKVSDNHKCGHFYSYRTVYGGSFSPR